MVHLHFKEFIFLVISCTLFFFFFFFLPFSPWPFGTFGELLMILRPLPYKLSANCHLEKVCEKLLIVESMNPVHRDQWASGKLQSEAHYNRPPHTQIHAFKRRPQKTHLRSPTEHSNPLLESAADRHPGLVEHPRDKLTVFKKLIIICCRVGTGD